MQACSCSIVYIQCTVHNNSQQSSTSKECTWKRKAKPNKSLEELKIAKTEYGKATKQAIKPTTFYPTSLELDHLLFMDSLRAGGACAISSSASDHRPQLQP